MQNPKVPIAKLLFPHPKVLPPGSRRPPYRAAIHLVLTFFSLFFHFFSDLDFGLNFDYTFGPFLAPKWTPKVLKILKNLVARRSLDFSSPLARFWLASGRSDPRSDCACAVETPLGRFWRRPENSSKSTPKCLRKATRNHKIRAKKRRRNSLQFPDAFWSDLGSRRGLQNDQNLPKSLHLPPPPKTILAFRKQMTLPKAFRSAPGSIFDQKNANVAKSAVLPW